MAAFKRWWKAGWLTAGVTLWLVALALPALVHGGKTIWTGWQAAMVAATPLVLGEPFGVFLVLLYPLLLVTIYAIVRGRFFALGTAIALLATMGLWGLSAPPEPRRFMDGGPYGGGSLALGFWMWMAAGVCLLVATVVPPITRQQKEWALAGLGYAVFVAIAWRVRG